MNQRAGKTYRAAASDGLQDMKLRNFFRTCKEVMESENLENEAFIFEQLEEHITSGKQLPSDRRDIIRILGI